MVQLSCTDIQLNFGGVRALSGVSFEVRQGEIFAIIGPNGAGKSSMLNCISGVYQPQVGKITFEGADISGFPPYDYFPRLRERRKQLSGYLSGGEQQMLAIGRALMARPKLILMDEPSLGIAPLLVQEIFRLIKKINTEEKTTILLVEQNANVAFSIADYAYIMEGGRIVLNGSTEQLKANDDVKEFYLGLSDGPEKKSYQNLKHYRRRKRWL